MKYAAKITWVWGLKEEKIFETRSERECFLMKNEESIDSSVIYSKSRKSYPVGDTFYSTTRNWSDYEMDVYL